MMTNDKLAELQREGQAYIAKARENADRNPGHPSSWSEPILADYNEQVAKAGEKLTEIREAKDDLAVIDKGPRDRRGDRYADGRERQCVSATSDGGVPRTPNTVRRHLSAVKGIGRCVSRSDATGGAPCWGGK
jgi:hypothetical protein